MLQTNNELLKFILVFALAFSFLINSVLFTMKKTRRSADDVVKINISIDTTKNTYVDDYDARNCKKADGDVQYDVIGDYIGCKY